MNYLISGSKGLIGSRLKKELDKNHKCVMEIDQRIGSNILNINSIRLTPSTQKTDYFFHVAAHCKIQEGIDNPELPHLNNANGVFEALEFCRKNNIKKFFYFSTSRILYPGKNPYTASKKYGEELCEAYRQCYGIDYIIVRPSTVYGEHHDLTTRLITKWVINAMKDRELILYGDENKTLDFTHVNDFVDGIMILLKNWENAKNQSYDICGEDERTLIEVAKIIQKNLNKQIVIAWEKPQITQPQQVKIDISKIKKFGFRPKIKLEDGIKRLIKFYKGEGKIWVKKNI